MEVTASAPILQSDESQQTSFLGICPSGSDYRIGGLILKNKCIDSSQTFSCITVSISNAVTNPWPHWNFMSATALGTENFMVTRTTGLRSLCPQSTWVKAAWETRAKRKFVTIWIQHQQCSVHVLLQSCQRTYNLNGQHTVRGSGVGRNEEGCDWTAKLSIHHSPSAYTRTAFT